MRIGVAATLKRGKQRDENEPANTPTLYRSHLPQCGESYLEVGPGELEPLSLCWHPI
jgi:hypothetical protein